MAKPYTVRWGILATGGIAKTFTKDLMVDPSARGVTDVHHTVTAVASSSSASRAQQFLKDCNCPLSTVAYGSYAELVADKDVDIIYIATPHSHHYQNAMLCLEAGKPILCEKSLTVNAAQTRKLVATAKERGLFLMEAVWTRYFPLSIEIRRMITEGELGCVYRVIADLSFGSEDLEKEWGTDHRMVNMDLAGGALLDLGIYSLTWLFQTLYHTLPASLRRPPSVLAQISKYAPTGCDAQTSVLLSFPSSPHDPKTAAHGIALTGLRVATDPGKHSSAGPAIRIQGTKAEVQVFGPAYRPTRYRVIRTAGKEAKAEVKDVDCEIPVGHGMFWEADEAARCLRDGKLESEGIGWEESCVIMDVMDEVRKQGGVRYPEKLESVEYPLQF